MLEVAKTRSANFAKIFLEKAKLEKHIKEEYYSGHYQQLTFKYSVKLFSIIFRSVINPDDNFKSKSSSIMSLVRN